MTVWSHPLSIYAMRRSKLLLCVILLFVVIITTLFVTSSTQAAPSTDRTISFSARLKNASGGVVADGLYNVSFNLYTVDENGTPIWSETYHDANGTTPGQDYRVQVTNGYLNVKLGSRTTFGSSVDWDDDLWLTMNIGGTEQVAIPNNIDWDGEMSPRIQLAAVPYAMSAGSIGGKTAGDFVQLGQGAQVDDSNNSSIHINKTGTGHLIQLQRNAEDIFTVSSAGDIALGGITNHSISIASSEASVDGHSLTISGGDGGSGTTNGGDLVLTGGSGSEGGADGLVILTTPTFATTTNDSNCYTGGAVVASSCTISQSAIDSSSAVMIGFSEADQTATLPDPTNATAGRIIYVIAATDSLPFTLLANGSDSMNVQPKSAKTLLWNGSDWVLAGGAGSPSSNLQDAYDSSVGGAEIVVSDGEGAGGIAIRDSDTDSVGGALLEVKNSTAANLLSVSSRGAQDSTEYIADGEVLIGGSNWIATGSASVTRVTNDGYTDSDSLEVEAGTAAGNGGANVMANNPEVDARYKVSMAVKLTDGSDFSDLTIAYSPDNLSSRIDCTNYSTRTITSDWTEVTCYIETDSTAVTAPRLIFEQPTAADNARTFLVDAVSFTPAPPANASVKVGSSGGGEDTTLFSLDRSDSAPTAGGNEALLGSMYYDTTKGKVQCYEAAGWGSCGDAPDTFVTISPQYTNAVMNGTDEGVITSDFCSDALDINDGSPGELEVCGTNETYNFYGWTSDENTDQTRSIYLTYQLPDNFKNFVAGSTSIMGRTDSSDAAVAYQIYRDNGTGLDSCSSLITVSNTAQTLWQKAAADGSDDPAECEFEPGDSILLRINLTSKDNANAYVSNVNFTFSNQ